MASTRACGRDSPAGEQDGVSKRYRGRGGRAAAGRPIVPPWKQAWRVDEAGRFGQTRVQAMPSNIPAKEENLMPAQKTEQLIPTLGVIETTVTDNILRWDGQDLYVETDVFHNGNLVHAKYHRKVTAQVLQTVAALLQGDKAA